MWSWLSAELGALVESGEQARFALDLSDQKISLVERTASGPRLRDAASHRSDDFELQLKRLRRRAGGRTGGEAPVDLLIPRELTLTRVETFPAEARRNLRDEAWWRLDAITPYRPEELCYDVALIGVEPQTGVLEVSIALAPRDIVEESIDYAERWGFAPQRVTTAEPVPGFPQGPLLHRAGEMRTESRGLRAGAATLAAIAIVLAVVGVLRGVAAREAQLREITAEAEIAEAALVKALERKSEALSLAERAMLPALRRNKRGYATDWLEALAETLPPQTRTDRVQVVDGRIRIEGVAVDADAALAAVATSDAFRAARLAEPPVPLAGETQRQSFVIEARLAELLEVREIEEALQGPPPPEPTIETATPTGAQGAAVPPEAIRPETEALAAR